MAPSPTHTTDTRRKNGSAVLVCRDDRPSATFWLARALLAFLSALIVTMALAQAAHAKPVKLVALGDSLSAGYLLPGPAAFPAQLERALRDKGYDVTIANAGVSGDTAAGGLSRLDWSVGEGVDGVILELGANDMLRGQDPARTFQSLDAIVTRLKGRGVRVLLTGIRTAPNMGEEYRQRFEPIFPQLAQKHGLILYPSFLDGVAGNRALNLADGIHPTAEGVGIIVQRMLPTVERFMKTLGAERSATR